MFDKKRASFYGGGGGGGGGGSITYYSVFSVEYKTFWNLIFFCKGFSLIVLSNTVGFHATILI